MRSNEKQSSIRLRALSAFGLSSALLFACAGRSSDARLSPVAPRSKQPEKQQGKTSDTFGLPIVVPKSRLMPDVEGSRGIVLHTEEGDLSIVSRMRLTTDAAGITSRADELLPSGRVVAQRVPGRLGGGFLFLAVTGRGSEIWRSATWLGKLEPLVAFGQVAHVDRPLAMGFDRIYVRFSSANEIVAIDPKTGSAMPYGSLPPAPGYGDMVFLDGWRAVVDTDLGGTFATFDAGSTWRRLPITARVRSIVATHPEAEDGGDAVVQVEGGSYRVSPEGHVTFTAAPPSPPGFATPPPSVRPVAPPTERAKAGPLGRRPLFVALERGYPESETTAVVVHEGTLARVSLETGAVLAFDKRATAPHAECTGIGLGKSGIGFVCGTSQGPTTIYELGPSLTLREVMRFAGPRVVTESGQGAIVVRGPCAEQDETGPTRPFCVRFADGSTREVRVRGDVGPERVIALEDKRVVILVPPRVGTQGQISILDKGSSKHVLLKMPEAGAPREAEIGLWMEGFQQVGKDEIAGWIEAGGPVFGAHVKLDGTVTFGEAVAEPLGTLTSGRFGLAMGDGGRMLESVDTGASWREIQVPRVDAASELSRVRRCGAVGCIIPGWLKVGWGESAHPDDMRDATAPTGAKLSTMKLSAQRLSLVCAAGRVEPKAKPGKKNEGTAVSGWGQLGGVDAPPMQKGEEGIDAGSPYDAVPMRAYAWGRKDSDWSRTGKLVIRYIDRFALEQVRSSAVTASPWSSASSAGDWLGVGTYGYGVAWSALRDHDSILASACRGRVCNIFSVAPGEPVLTLRSTESTSLPRPNGAVKVGQVWFFLGDAGVPDQVALFRADLGNVRQVSTFKRLTPGRFTAAALPKLIRKARGDGLGMMFTLREGPTDRRGTRYVLPIDMESGEVQDPVRLGRPDFADVPVRAGCGDTDGWSVELPVEPAPTATIDGAMVNLEAVEVRAVIGDGSVCVESAAGSLAYGPSEKTKSKGRSGAGGGAGFSLMAADCGTGARRELVCDISAPAAPALNF